MSDLPPPEEPALSPVASSPQGEGRRPEFVEGPVEGISFPPTGGFPSTPTIPHNREAEEAVVGAVLINPEVYYDLAQFLQADDFYIHRLRWIWEAFTRLHEQRTPLDILTVTEELDRAGQLGEIGGPAYLTALLNQVPTSLHAEAYGHMVEATAIRRRMLNAANQIATLAYDEHESVEHVMEEAEKSVFDVSQRRLRHDLQPISAVLSEYYDRIDELARRPEEIFGVPTGFIDLDRMLTGMQASDFLIIAGRPGQGKTGFLLSAAKNAAMLHKKHVAIFSLEMSNEQVVQRLVAQETGIDSQRLRTGKLNQDEWPLFTQAVEVLSDTHIFLDDTPAISPLQLRTKCRRLHMEFGLDLVLVDYLQLMGGDVRTENRVQEVSYISRNLKVLARELNVPVLAAAQLSRAVEQRTDKRPVLSDLRESGSLEQDSDVVMFIYRPDQYEKDTVKQNVAEIIIAKHRNGPTGSIELIFRSNLAKFENAATRAIDFTASPRTAKSRREPKPPEVPPGEDSQ
jgi:replicative DNA helicase